MKQFFAWLASFGPMGLLGLSFVECLGIPNPGGTDFALVAFAAARPQDAFLGAMLASLGSIVGSAVFFEITRKGGEAFLNRYTATARANKFRKWYRYYGLATVFISALVPIPILPLKVFAACAGAMGVARSRFLTVLGLARIPRYLGLAYLGTRLGPESWPWVKSHVWQLSIFAGLLFAILFGGLRWFEQSRLGRVQLGES